MTEVARYSIDPGARARGRLPPAPLDMTLHYEVETAFHASECSRESWDRTVLELGAPIYMTYDWLRTWWEHYGQGRQLRLFRFREGQRPIAAIPLYLESFGIGPCRTRVARIVGANIPPKVFNPPLEPSFATEVMARIQEHLFTQDRCDLLSFGPVSENWSGTTGLRTSVNSASVSYSYSTTCRRSLTCHPRSMSISRHCQHENGRIGDVEYVSWKNLVPSPPILFAIPTKSRASSSPLPASTQHNGRPSANVATLQLGPGDMSFTES